MESSGRWGGTTKGDWETADEEVGKPAKGGCHPRSQVRKVIQGGVSDGGKTNNGSKTSSNKTEKWPLDLAVWKLLVILSCSLCEY